METDMEKPSAKQYDFLAGKLNTHTLRFTMKENETLFHAYYATKHLWQLRIAHILAILLFMAATLADYYLLDLPSLSTLLNLLIVVPIFMSGYMLTFVAKSFYKKHYKIFNIIYVSATSLAFLFAGIMAIEANKHFLYTGIIICMIFNYTFIKQDFIKASITGIIILLIYLATVFYENTGIHLINHLCIYIVAINILGIFIAYSIEFDGKKTFLLLKKIETDKKHIRKINRDLKKLVQKKTVQLEKRNKELQVYQNNLEQLITERTKELEEKNKELNRFNQLFIGREIRIKKLREEVKVLETKLKKQEQI
jgi:hypothetical protein